MVPLRLKALQGIWPLTFGKGFKRCFESLSQNETVPSAPTVENVPYTGWKDIALTENTLLLLSR